MENKLHLIAAIFLIDRNNFNNLASSPKEQMSRPDESSSEKTNIMDIGIGLLYFVIREFLFNFFEKNILFSMGNMTDYRLEK